MRAFGIFTAPKRSLRQGNFFTGVCLSMEDWYPSMHHRSHNQHPGGGLQVLHPGVLHPGGLHLEGSAYRDADPRKLGRPLDADPSGTRKAGSMHPTGMFSCCDEYSLFTIQ